MVDRRSVLAAGGLLALALSGSAHAASVITIAAIATGRLYVLGTTDRPHTSVSLDGRFTTSSDDAGRFQFEVVYYPVGCVVRATIDGQITTAKVTQCGEICEPAPKTPASSPAVSNLGPAKPTPQQQAALPALPGRTADMALRTPQLPQTTNAVIPSRPTALQPESTKAPEPILHPPMPPPRPRDVSVVAARRLSPAPTFEPRANKPSRESKPPQQDVPDDQPNVDRPDAPEGSDVY